MAAVSPRLPRLELGLSLDDAARVIGVNRATLSRYELSPTAVESEALRKRIAGFYSDIYRAIEAARRRRATGGKPA